MQVGLEAVGVPCLTVEETKQQSEKTELDLGGKREPRMTCEQKRDNINCALGRLIWSEDGLLRMAYLNWIKKK